MANQVSQQMGEALVQAEAALRQQLATNPNMSAIELMQFHQQWFWDHKAKYGAGHKRLGQLYVRIAKEIANGA